MPVIDTTQYLDELSSLAKGYGLPLEGFTAVPSIMEWCQERGVDEDNPFRIGKVVQDSTTKKYLVLLSAEIDEEYVTGSLIPALQMRGLEAEAGRLKEPETLLKHLVLHEIAHIKNKGWTEAECDRWAFQELINLQSN